MAYFGVFLFSIVSCFIGFALESLNGNISHMKNGRIPNAGAAIIPAIPVIPIVYLAVAWGVNQVHENFGFIVIFTYSCVSIILRVVLCQKANTKLQRLILESRLNNISVKDSDNK